MKFSHSDGAESFRIEVNSYDPDIGSTAIQPDFSIVVIRRVKVDRSPASVKSRMDHRTYDETLGREVEIHDRFVGDKLKLRIVSSVPVSANDSTLPARWDAFLEALAEYLAVQ